MLSKIKGLIVLSVLLLTVNPIYAEVVPEVTFSGGYTDNLFNDASSIDDSYATVSPLFQIYPSASTELTLSGSFTSYFDNEDLSNFSARAGITFIPELEVSKLNLMFSADIAGRSYGDLYEIYNSWGVDLDALFSYRAAEVVVVRGGGSLGKTDYPNSDIGSSDGLGFFGGINITPFGSNSLNFEAGASLQRYVTGLDSVAIGGGRQSAYSTEDDKSGFHVVYFSARYSRPLGLRTGVNAIFTERQITKEPDSAIAAFSVDDLSPWTTLWGGRSFSTNVKNFPGFDFILEAGVTYTSKDYIESYEPQQRDDDRLAFNVQIQRPFSTASKMLIKPALQLRWVDNSSTLTRYDYSFVEGQVRVLFKF